MNHVTFKFFRQIEPSPCQTEVTQSALKAFNELYRIVQVHGKAAIGMGFVEVDDNSVTETFRKVVGLCVKKSDKRKFKSFISNRRSTIRKKLDKE